ncbi:MAG: aminopeptidase, partial [Lachnospiraceae bacterium]|nr:aminopeptidase [Lachnospiraceae bacterium]
MATKKAEPTKDKKGTKPSKNAWLKYSEKEKKAVFDFAEGYRKFISDCKTERECVDEVLRQAKAEGYVDLKDAIAKNTKLKAGDKVYVNHMGKAVALFLIGEQPLENG